MKSSILLILTVNILIGCTSSSSDMFDNEGKSTMLEMHKKHVSELYGNKLERARTKYGSITGYEQQRRITFNDDLRLPNPELHFVVFPKRNVDGSVSPEVIKRFSMYRKVHYQVGGY